VRIAAAAAVALLAILSIAPAAAQRASYRGVSDCSRVAAVTFKRQDRGFRRFVIDRASVSQDRYAKMVGNQYVAAIYSGGATYEAGGGERKVTFICLHSGDKGALLVYTVPR